MDNVEAESLAEEREVRTNERENTVAASVRIIKWLVIVLIIVSVGNFARTFVNQKATDKTTKAAESLEQTTSEARDASVSTLAELRAIVIRLDNANEDEPDLQNQAIIDALSAVARIEGYICGGPCPEPKS